MQLEYAENAESEVRTKRVAFSLPAMIKALPLGEPVLRIHPTPDGALVTVREDGTVNYWSSKLQLRKSKRVFVSIITITTTSATTINTTNSTTCTTYTTYY